MNVEKKNSRIGRALIYLFLVIWAILVLFPFYWMLLTSVKTQAAFNSEIVPSFWTPHPTIENYTSAFTTVPLGRYFLNTVIFTVATTALMMAAAISPASFSPGISPCS